jgi:site-specific recombinase XerD
LRRPPGRAPVPEPLWPWLRTEAPFVPYVLTDREVHRPLELAAALDQPRFRASLYRTLLLLCCTGLRLGEALHLGLRDVDTRVGALFVEPIEGQARWVRFHHPLARELDQYLTARPAAAPTRREDRFFVGANYQCLPVSTDARTMRRLFQAAGLKPAHDSVGLRPYDLRRPIALEWLIRWYRQGVDLHVRLACLSAYKGHTDLVGTEPTCTPRPRAAPAALPRLSRREEHDLMSRTNRDILVALVQSFFQSYQLGVRAYRDAFRLFLLFLVQHRQRRWVAELTLDDIQADAVLAFLEYVESRCGNSAAPRNCRLVALRSFGRHLLHHDVTRADQYGRMLAIASKGTAVHGVTYLEPEEARAIIPAVDPRALHGARDRVLRLLRCNTG